MVVCWITIKFVTWVYFKTNWLVHKCHMALNSQDSSYCTNSENLWGHQLIFACWVVQCAAPIIRDLIAVCNHNLFTKLPRHLSAVPEIKPLPCAQSL